MELCSLCLESNENYLNLSSDEAKESSMILLLLKYFPFCFESEPIFGILCGKCRCQIEAFHLFFTRIESIHSSTPQGEIIFVEPLDPIKNDVFDSHVSSDSDQIENLPESPVQNRNSERKKKQKKRRCEPKISSENAVAKKPKQYSRVSPYITGPIVCEICGEKLLTENQLLRHKKSKHELLPFKCNSFRCSHSFATAKELAKHEAKDHARAECAICKKLMQISQLEKHRKIFHDRSERVICDVCGKEFLHKYDLRLHTETEHEITDRPQCDICGKVTRNIQSMRSHMKLHSDGIQICKVCGKVNPHRRALRSHMDIHKPPKHVCNVCGKGFHKLLQLRDHLTIHSGHIDRYVCSCGRGFRFNSSYYAHRKNCPTHIAFINDNQQNNSVKI